MKTYVINLIAGPGVGKSTIAAGLFCKLKSKKVVCEFVQEWAKNLVWSGDFETLNNQYYVVKKQYELIKRINNKVKIIVLDFSLLQCLYYNKHNPDNTSDVIKTEEYIISKFKEFNNINIFLERVDGREYEHEGRLQSLQEAKQIDLELKRLIDEKGVLYTSFSAELENIDKILEKIDF